jgi:hypothetical protein
LAEYRRKYRSAYRTMAGFSIMRPSHACVVRDSSRAELPAAKERPSGLSWRDHTFVGGVLPGPSLAHSR